MVTSQVPKSVGEETSSRGSDAKNNSRLAASVHLKMVRQKIEMLKLPSSKGAHCEKKNMTGIVVGRRAGRPDQCSISKPDMVFAHDVRKKAPGKKLAD